MRRILFIALGGAVALVTAAVAVAVAVIPVAGVSATTADFTAGTVVKSKTRTCTGLDTKKYEITEGRYTGTMTSTPALSNPVLDGALTIHARTTYDTTNPAAKLGYVQGSFRVKDDDSRVSGKFWGTLSNGNLVGFLEGKSRGNHAVVLGNMSATFDPAATTGFTGGKLGLGSSSTMLAVIAGPVCKDSKSEHGSGSQSDKPKRLHVEGTATLTGAPPTAITVAPKHGPVTPPCAIPAAFVLPVIVSGVTNVEMECESIMSGTPPTTVLTLTKLKLHK